MRLRLAFLEARRLASDFLVFGAAFGSAGIGSSAAISASSVGSSSVTAGELADCLLKIL